MSPFFDDIVVYPKTEEESLKLVKEHLKIVMSRRKNYTNHHHQEVNIRVEDQVYLQATYLKGTKHFHVKGKLTPRINTPPEVTTRRRADGYQLELPPELPTMHNVST